MVELNKIIEGHCLIGLRNLPDECVDCCPTSPPYFGLRDYGVEKTKWDAVTYSILGFEVVVPEMECCLGLEETPKQFIGHLVAIFREVKRVLKKEGTIWVNIGDSYNSGASGGLSGSTIEGGQTNQSNSNRNGRKVLSELKSKDMIGIPWMLAYALRDDGWYLRQDIIWHKPNPMPESVTDRCTKAHEYIFLMSKSAKYYYDAEAIKDPCLTNDNSNRDRDITKLNNVPGRTRMAGLKTNDYEMANKRSVWTVTTKPYSEAHFATFPEDLIVDMIKAGCPEGGNVLDPFMGAGTTALVAAKLNRNYIGFELNESYLKIAKKRLEKHLGFFNPAYHE